MKKNVTSYNFIKSMLAFGFLSLGIYSCNKTNNNVANNNTPQTGSYSLTLGGTTFTGSAFSDGSNKALNDFTNEPMLEVFLNGDNSQMSLFISNPTLGTPIKCGVANSANVANFTTVNSGISNNYTSGNIGDVTVTLTKLTELQAEGTITGVVNDVNNLSGASTAITNGSFTINF